LESGFQKSLKTNPKPADVLLALAAAYQQQGKQPKEAIAANAKGLVLERGDPDGLANASERHDDKAIATYQKLLPTRFMPKLSF